MTRILAVLLAIGVAAILVVAPNGLWLNRSSAVVRNAGSEPLELRLVVREEPGRILGEARLGPGEARMFWVDVAGEASLEVEIRDGDAWRRHCGEYVEQSMYRVEVTARSPAEVACRTELPLTSRLLIRDYLN
jgi:hypothetical protein